MEKQRCPAADIQFTISGEAVGKQSAPLLFIQFVENSFNTAPTGSTIVALSTGRCAWKATACTLCCGMTYLRSPPLPVLLPYGGVGIENVRKRLALYYPHQHTLSINKTHEVFEVQLSITALSFITMTAPAPVIRCLIADDELIAHQILNNISFKRPGCCW